MEATDDTDRTKTILVLTDFTKSALNAADYALFLATQLRTNVLLFHSYDISVSEFKSLQINDYLAETSKSNLKKEVIRLKSAIKPSVSNFKPHIDYLSESGSVEENVCSIIDKKKNVLMVVMGGFKAHSNNDFLFGTAIKAVVSRARCPAVIVPEFEFLRV